MSGYDFVLRIMKYGFSGLLLLISLYGFYSVFKKDRSPRAMVSWPVFFALILVLVSLVLLFSDHTSHRDFLNLVKIISGIFTVIYGIYATLNDFYEDNPEGRRVITRIGLIGIILFFFSALLSVGADYIKRGIEKQALEERRQYLERIVDKLVVVDKKSGKLGLNLQKFTKTLMAEVKQANSELEALRVKVAARETKIQQLEKNLDANQKEREKIGVRNLELNRKIAATEKLLQARTAGLDLREKALRELDARFAATSERLRTTEQSLADLRRESTNDKKLLTSRNNELSRLKDSLARNEARLQAVTKSESEKSADLLAARKALTQTKENLNARAASLAASEKELEIIRGRVKELRAAALKREALLAAEKKKRLEQKAKLDKQLTDLLRTQAEIVRLMRKLDKAAELRARKPAAPAPTPKK